MLNSQIPQMQLKALSNYSPNNIKERINLNKEIISPRKIMAMMIVFALGSSIIIGGSTELKQDSWISIIAGALMSLPIAILYARIVKLFPGKNIYEVSLTLFGKFFGRIIIILMTWYAFHLCALVLRNFSEFIQVTSKPETPQIIVMLAIVLVASYLVKSGVETMGRWSLIVLPVVIAVVMFTIVLAFRDIQIENLFPVFDHTIKEILTDSYLLFTFPYAETVLFLAISDSLKKGKSSYAVILPAALITTLVLVMVVLRNIILLGQEMVSISLFPSYTAVRIISLGKFLTKIEGVIMINFILLGVSKIAVSLLAACKGITTLFNVQNYKIVAVPLSLLTIALGIILYENTIQMFDFIKIYQFYAIPFQIVIPLLIWIFGEIKMRKIKKDNLIKDAVLA